MQRETTGPSLGSWGRCPTPTRVVSAPAVSSPEEVGLRTGTGRQWKFRLTRGDALPCRGVTTVSNPRTRPRANRPARCAVVRKDKNRN